MIYISGALMGSSDLSAARELYERVAGMVEGLGQDAYVPHKATDPEGNPTIPPGEVFRTAVDNILASKGVIAFLNEPSLGVGAEIAICIHESIPVLGACCKSVNCGGKGHSAHRYGPKMRYCALWRPDFCHFEGFRLPIRWVSRALGLLQQAPRALRQCCRSVSLRRRVLGVEWRGVRLI